MKFEYTWTGNWAGAMCGMRHAMKSHGRADSMMMTWVGDRGTCGDPRDTSMPIISETSFGNKDVVVYFYIGDNDMKLCQNLILASKGGKVLESEDKPFYDLIKEDGNAAHTKFLRQIFVSVDITAPRYFWQEMDTYKVDTTANSESTMHTILKDEISLDCLEPYMYECDSANDDDDIILQDVINRMKFIRDDSRYSDLCKTQRIKAMIPESWLQKRHWSASYATVRNAYHQRKHHRLPQWNTHFANWVKSLPYAAELICN